MVCSGADPSEGELVPIDIDVSPFDNKVCRREEVHYIIKRNMRKESREQSREEWLNIVMEDGELEESRSGKGILYTG